MTLTGQSRSKQNHSEEHGSVIFYVLIAIVLFAALSFAVGRMNRGSADINRETSALRSSELLQYAAAVKSAVQAARVAQCQDSDISFANNFSSTYDNANTVSNECKIFSPAGQAVFWQKPSDNISNGRDWIYSGATQIQGIGTDCGDESCSDLMMVLEDISEMLCIRLNENLSVTNPSGAPPADSGETFTKFTGTYSYDSGAGPLGDEDAALDAKPAACYQDSDDNKYYFYYSLLAR